MKPKIWLGCDPGKYGAVAAIYEDGKIKWWTVPIIGKVIDINAFKNIFLQLIEFTPEGEYKYDIMCAIEDVHAIQQSGASSAFSFGFSAGSLEGIVSALDIPYMKVQPKKWQGISWEGVPVMYKPGKKVKNKFDQEVIKQDVDTKNMSLLAAKRLFPNTKFLATPKCTTDHDGIVDALLIAYYCKIKHS